MEEVITHTGGQGFKLVPNIPLNATDVITINKINMSTLYKIIYSNHFKVENKTFAFRLKNLFDISDTPIFLELKDNNGSKGYWINRKWFSLTKIKHLIINEPKEVDITGMNWYRQEQINHCINLEIL